MNYYDGFDRTVDVHIKRISQTREIFRTFAIFRDLDLKNEKLSDEQRQKYGYYYFVSLSRSRI